MQKCASRRGTCRRGPDALCSGRSHPLLVDGFKNGWHCTDRSEKGHGCDRATDRTHRGKEFVASRVLEIQSKVIKVVALSSTTRLRVRRIGDESPRRGRVTVTVTAVNEPEAAANEPETAGSEVRLSETSLGARASDRLAVHIASHRCIGAPGTSPRFRKVGDGDHAPGPALGQPPEKSGTTRGVPHF
jgi:hypothetical protein